MKQDAVDEIQPYQQRDLDKELRRVLKEKDDAVRSQDFW